MTAKRSTFYCLSGRWNFNRIYTSYLADHPSGSATGVAQIERRSSKQDAVLEYLYSEEAEFTPKNEQENIKGTQKYAYLLDTETDKLNVYFVERNADALAGRLFHEIRFEENSDGLIKASGEHFCSPDNYNVKYEFEFKNEELSSWTVEYEVKGPRKNYTISTCYIRI